MPRDPVPPASPSSRRPAGEAGTKPFLRPWPLLLGGLVATVVGLVLARAASWMLPALAVFAAGLIAAGLAVSRRLQSASQELEERVESACLLALAGFVALLACLGMSGWDSFQWFFGVLVAVALVGSVLVLLPSLWRRVIVSVLIVVHFGGMLTATTSVDPPNSQAPWLSTQLWVRFYRPYLTFMYLGNAYHFYSPDPGPATLLWFRVQYEDGSHRWRHVPDRDDSPHGMHYQRMLALTESTNSPLPRLPFSYEEAAMMERATGQPYTLYIGPSPAFVARHDPWEVIVQRRRLGATMPQYGSDQLQLADDVPLNVQYREPQDVAKMLVASYAKYVAWNSPHPTDPAVAVKSVKVYRVVHNLISPAELSQGGDPLDKTHYLPYFQGEFDRDGKMVNPQDPFLYWMLPVVRVPRDYPASGPLRLGVPLPPDRSKLLDCLEIHASAGDPEATAEQKKP
jgi:hypothetical protein